jgi:hypothetical protein
VHHCHIVNIRGNSYRLMNHAELHNARHTSASAATKRPAPWEADAT